MEFYIINPEIESKFNEIRKRIKRLQSGGTIDSLQTIGADTRGQVGASFVSLKTLAKQYEQNEKLARMLWEQKKREEQIMACFLFPTNLNKEKITQFIQGSYNFEITEYFGSILLSHHPLLAEIATEWSNSNIPFMQISALTAIARHYIVYKQERKISHHLYQEIINKPYTHKYVALVAQRYRFNN